MVQAIPEESSSSDPTSSSAFSSSLTANKVAEQLSESRDSSEESKYQYCESSEESEEDEEEQKQPVDNSLSGLVTLNEKEVNKKHVTIEEFSVEEFHSHAMLKVLKNEPITKVNIGGYFGLDCSDAVFNKLLKYIVENLETTSQVEDAEGETHPLVDLQLCHKTLVKADRSTFISLAQLTGQLKKFKILYTSGMGPRAMNIMTDFVAIVNRKIKAPIQELKFWRFSK